MVAVHGLDARQGETAFAFFVVRLRAPVARTQLPEIVRFVAPLLPDPEAYLDALPEDLEDTLQIIGMPWAPPEAGHPVDAQRRLVEAAREVGVEAAWFFQCGTSLAADEEGEDENAGEDDEEEAVPRERATDDAWDDALDTMPVDALETNPIERVEVAGELGDDQELQDDEEIDDDELEEEHDEAAEVTDDSDASWSNGLPARVQNVRFPVDAYPEIIDEYDWQDFGIAVKLAGLPLPGERSVLIGFHALWLAPYGDQYRNAAVTYDREHHAARLWVDRFAASCEPDILVDHLLWIAAQIDEVFGVVHARFEGAEMQEKFGGLVGDTRAPFVLAGNPLNAIALAELDAWIEDQREWTNDEIAQMLRERAVETVTGSEELEDEQEDDDEDEDQEEEEVLDEEDEGDDDDDDDGDDDDEEEEDEGDDDDDEAEGNEDEDRGRQIASYAGDLLRERARTGKLDPRVADQLIAVLDQPAKYEHRRRSVVEILGALRHRTAVPALVRILEQTTIESSLDSIGKEDFIASTAAALGEIGDPDAIAALAKVVAAPGNYNDEPRAVAANALATCLAAAPEPRDVDDAVLAQLLATIRECNDGELSAETHFAYGHIARQLHAERRAEAHRRLAEHVADEDDDAPVKLARHAALAMAGGNPAVELRELLHEVLTSLDYDHDYTIRNLRTALRVAQIVPDLVDPADLLWLTRFDETDIRDRAHAVLERLGRSLSRAPVYDATSARDLADDALARAIGERHVVGRAALIAEAGRRGLADARAAIISACDEVVAHARPGNENLLRPDARVLELAVPILARAPIAPEATALFDRMLRSSNPNIKWALMHAAPKDERLIPGMFYVLGEKWGWQEDAAKEWLQHFQGTPAYEAARARVTDDQATN